MYIDRILAPIETLGPGNRLVIWVKGCSKHCKGCANPELWSVENCKSYSVEDVFHIIENVFKENSLDGVTISGGDPLEQKEEILELLRRLNTLTQDILVYTGYTMNELDGILSNEEMQMFQNNIAVLIDGRYEEQLNHKDVVLRGSSNQQIIYFKDAYKERYEKYLLEGRKIQNVYMGKRLVSVGIHDRRE